MIIVMCVVGTVLAQLALALFIAKCFRAGKKRRAVEAGLGAGEPPPAASGPGRPRAAIDTYAELAALLVALSPQPEGTPLKEHGALSEPPQPKLPGPWPGPRRQ
jgi:hypothetical protein